MNVREKLEVIAHLGDHISYKEDIGICYDSALAKVIEDAYMELKNGVTVQEWISVKDRLPEAMEWVICATTYKTICILRYDHIMDDWDLFGNANRCYVKTFVTHWMPLPQPPKGE